MLITVEHLTSWATKPEARTALPDLVRRLVLASGAKLRRLDLPGGTAVDRPGVDGIVEAGPGNPWVLEGRSVWELSCQADPRSKAGADLAKRTEAMPAEERASTTFVFVTPRRWGGKAKWKESAQVEGWKEVRAYDADDLVQWLDASPAVALWFAEKLGILGPGVESPERFVERWARTCEPAITPGALATGRFRPLRSLGHALKQRLQRDAFPAESPPRSEGPILLRADSEEEAVAFAAALLARSKSLAARTLVVTSAEGWRFVERNPTIRIALAASSEVARQAPPREGLVVLVPHAAGDPTAEAERRDGDKVEEIVLPRPTAWAMERALGRIGIGQARAERLASRCGRSWSVFRRSNARNPAIRRPPWLDRPESRSLKVLVLLEAFTDKEGDREVVAEIAGQPWQEIEGDLRTLASLDDAPAVEIGPWRSANRAFTAKSALDLLHLWGERITSGELDRFFAVAARLLAEPDPALELPPDARWDAATSGKTRRYSEILLSAVAGALPRLAVFGPETGLRRFDIEARIGVLVRDLLHGADSARWLSLSSFLPELAEAAPEVFLDAVERALERPDPPIAALFTESGDSHTGRHYFVSVLWALETLAWSRAHVRRVAEILALLSANPRPANIVNSAAGSLAKIFCPWAPQTSASLEDRLALLDALERAHLDLVFDIRLGMLPPRVRAILFPSPRPTWREEGLREARVTIDEYRRAVEAAADRAIASAKGNPERLATLIEKLDRFREVGREERVLETLASFANGRHSDDVRSPVWHALRERIHTDELDWKRPLPLRPSALQLARLYRALAPRDPVLRHVWLFDAFLPHLPGALLHFEARERVVERQWIRAIRALARVEGIPGLLRLGERAAWPGLVGRAAARAGIDPRDLVREAISRNAFSMGGDAPIEVMARAAVHEAPMPFRREALEIVLGHLVECRRPASEVAFWLGSWRDDPALRDLIDAQSEKVRRELRRRFPAGTEDIRLLLAEGEPARALDFLFARSDHCDPELLLEALEKLAEIGSPSDVQGLSYHIIHIILHLEKATQIDRTRLARVEFALLPLLRKCAVRPPIGALFEAVTTDPATFVELSKAVFKAEGGPARELDERSKAVAERAWIVLKSCSRIPGRRTDGTVDAEALNAFVDRARELAGKAGRLEVCDLSLGEILAHAPEDADGVWPCRAVAALLDRPGLDEVRRGFRRGIRFSWEVATRKQDEGGEGERALAETYRKLADRLAIEFPRVAATLRELGEDYERKARREDEKRRARQEGLR